MASKSLLDWPRESTISTIFFSLGGLLIDLSAIPVSRFLSSPTGLSARFLTPLLSGTLLRVSNGASAIESKPLKAVALLSLFYVFGVFVLSAIMSVTAQLMGNKTGYKNKEPRLIKRHLTGLPHRMVATHEALYDIFPAYALAAALFASSVSASDRLTPAGSTALNALVLHVFLKLFVFAPAYVLDVDLVRTCSHVTALGAILNAFWDVAVA
ncbi:membrane protein [Favolaschia claudopus]|uniref:Membrane protein n=1 Tax=Favolaschia claudopus TaxID=2862362 RepID=A0AAW0BQY7_9AGAR